MQRLVILDYSNSAVHFYTVDEHCYVTDDFIESLGFQLDEISWMLSDDLDVFKHKGMLC